MQTKIKFSDVPIGGRFKYNDLYCLKVSESKYFHIYKEQEYLTRIYETWTEVELITKCANCKHCDSGVYSYCNILTENIDSFLNQNPETFSCSNFKLKENADEI